MFRNVKQLCPKSLLVHRHEVLGPVPVAQIFWDTVQDSRVKAHRTHVFGCRY